VLTVSAVSDRTGGHTSAERDHPGVYIIDDGMLLTRDIILCLATIATLGSVIPSGCLTAKSVCAQTRSQAKNDIMGKIKEHVFQKSVRSQHQGPGCSYI